MTTDEELKKKVLEIAEKKLPGFHVIIDLFDMTFVYVTKEGAEVNGYTQEEMMGHSISEFMSVKNQDESFRQTIMKTMIGGIVRIPIRQKSGKEVFIEMKHVVVELEGHSFLVTKSLQKPPEK